MGNPVVAKNRKQLRKEKRQAKKTKRKQYYERSQPPEQPIQIAEPPKPKENVEKLRKEKDKRKELKEKSRAAKRNRQLLQDNEKEDKIIKSLEKRLKIKKKKNNAVPKSFHMDGLGYLLEVCDKSDLYNTDREKDKRIKRLRDGNTEADDDSEPVLKKSSIKETVEGQDSDMESSFKKHDESDEDAEESEEVNENSGDEDFKDDFDEDQNSLDGSEDSHHSSDDDHEGNNDDFEGEDDDLNHSSAESNDHEGNNEDFENEDVELNSTKDSKTGNKSKGNQDYWEDIYGRRRDKSGNIIEEKTSKYIPPDLRENSSTNESSDKMDSLKRQIKGLLNKVAGSNMHWTSSQLEKIYLSYSRHSVNNAFCSLWMQAVIKPITSFDRMVIEYAMLVAILHANVGSEIGAHFLQSIAQKFDELLSNSQELEDKQLDNLVLGLSYLFNFKMFHSSLIYDVLNKLMSQLSEKSIDCVLIALKAIGGCLRKEDPLALKSFIHSTQEISKTAKDSTSSGCRINFLLDILLAIKNNNLNKIPNYDPSYSDEMKKAIKGIIRKGNTVTCLNITLEDLLNAEKKGKWWVVGSAWESTSKSKTQTDTENSTQNDQHNYLMQLADGQRINTDLRRNIFAVIMSAEDYQDGFEKLLKLNLSPQQEREIVNVLLSCCMQEKKFNQYYAVLGQKFCNYDRRFQLSFQYSIWDKIKELDNFKTFNILNLSHFLAHLFIEKGLSISILKIIQFAELSKQSMKLMKQILITLLLHKNQQQCLDVFQRITVSPKLHMFRESLRLFINHFLLRNLSTKDSELTNEKIERLKCRCASVDKVLQADLKLSF